MKNGPSKFQVILLIVFGACAVGGVLIFAFAIGGATGNGIGSVTIWGPFEENTFNSVLRQAADSNAAFSGIHYSYKDPATYESDLLAALASGKGPDIFIVRSDYAMKDASAAYPIPFSSFSQAQFQTAFIDAASPFISQNLQAVIAVPLLADPLVLYWNKDLLSAAGYSRPPTYWDEVTPMATYVTNASADVNKSAVTVRDQGNTVKKSAIALGEYQNINNAKDTLATLILQAGGTITQIDTSNHVAPALSTQAGVVGVGNNPAESALRFYTEFSNPSKNDYSWNRSLDDARAVFAAGDLGLYVGYASEQVQIKKMNPNLNFAVAPLPQVRGGAKTLTFAHVYGLAISLAGKNQAAAIQAAYLLAGTDMSKALGAVYSLPSARRDVLSQKVQGDADLFNRAAIVGQAWVDPDPDKTNDIFRAMIEDTTSGAVSPSEAVQRADQSLAHILRQQ